MTAPISARIAAIRPTALDVDTGSSTYPSLSMAPCPGYPTQSAEQHTDSSIGSQRAQRGTVVSEAPNSPWESHWRLAAR